MKIKKIIICLICFSSCVFASYAESSQNVRVAILQDIQSARVKVGGFYEIIAADNNEVLYRGKNLNTTITTCKDGIVIAGLVFKRKSVLLKAADVEAIILNDRKFRGNIEIIRNNLNLSLINHIELEDYVKGILYHEASHYWPIEALKAQAVVCRTYAVYQMQANSSKDFDVTSDIYSQVYGGKTSERYRTTQAVEVTQGKILIYQGKVFPSYYHATCAGHTEDASLLWNINLPPLKGVVCNFCKDSPHYSWHFDISKNKLTEKLSPAGFKIDNIENAVILGRDSSGRVTKLKINGNKKNIEISAKDLRNILGPNLLRSTNFNVSVVGNDLVFQGLGWGHGAGLCQWGAYFMAKQGAKFDEILKYYYPGAQISSVVK